MIWVKYLSKYILLLGLLKVSPVNILIIEMYGKKIKTLGFWFSYQNTPYETLISPNLNCDLVTSLQSLNLNLNSAVFKYVALLYKGKVVIANQFLYQNTPYGTLMSPNLNCGLATQLSLINLNLKSAISKYVAFQLKGKTVIANQFLYQNKP